jgi:hypothetical protein
LEGIRNDPRGSLHVRGVRLEEATLHFNTVSDYF